MKENKGLDLSIKLRLENLKDSEYTNQQISEMLGITVYTVKNEYRRNGGRHAYTAENSENRKMQSFKNIKESNKFRKKRLEMLTFEEREKIENLKYSNLSGQEIGDLIGRHKNVVNREFRLAGGREIYNAVKAQKEYEFLKENRYKVFRKGNEVIKKIVPIKEIEKDISGDFIKNIPSSQHSSTTTLPDYIPKLPLKIWIERYIEEVAPTRNFWKKEKKYFEFWIKHLGDRIAVDITPSELESTADILLITQSHKAKDHYLSKKTRYKYLLYLSSLFNISVKEWKWAIFNPCSCIKISDGNEKKKGCTDFKNCIPYMDIKKCIHDESKKYLMDKNLTMRQLASEIGFSLSTFQNIISEDANTSLYNVIKVADKLGFKLHLIKRQ